MTGPSEDAVRLHDVAVRYGTTRALAGLDLSIRSGRITALLGPNGAGKSTTVGVIAGLVTPDSGTVEVLGAPAGSPAARSRLSVMLQEGGIPTGATACSIVKHHAALRGDPASATSVIDELDLTALGRTTFRRMSGGQRRRVALGCALVGDPVMVVVDEPTAGLDPTARRTTWEILDRLRSRGVTVLLSTHDLDEAERLGDDIVIIDRGRAVLSGPREQILGDSPDAVVFDGPLHLDTTSLRDALPAAIRIDEIVPGRYRIHGEVTPADITTVTAWAGQHGIAHHRIRVATASLEDIYFAVTNPPATDEPTTPAPSPGGMS